MEKLIVIKNSFFIIATIVVIIWAIAVLSAIKM
jgi:hypothetical protein